MESIEHPLDCSDLPLCVQQEHLLLSREYFRHQGVRLGPSTVPCILHLQGTLSYKAVEDALNEIVCRHPALRAECFQVGPLDSESRIGELHSFASTGVFRPGLYRQIVFEYAYITLRILDLSACPTSERPAETRRQIQSEASYEFNYTEPPLIRATLLRVDTTEHLLILTIDHLVSDAWSMRIIRREFAQIYSRLSGGGQSLLEDPRLSYPAYAVLQETLGRGGFARALDYWQGQWAAYSASRVSFDDLRFSLPQPKGLTYAFGSESSSFDPDTSSALRTFVRKARVTLYMLFLTALGLLLRRYTSKDRLAIWGHFANRMRPEVQSAVGWFANTHIIGIDMTADPSARSLMLRVRQTVIEASEHQEMPVFLVWRAMGSYPRHPDARVLLDFGVSDEPRTCEPSELRITHAVDLNPSFGRFASLGLYIRDDRERINLSVQYAVDRFPQTAVRQLLEDFQGDVIRILSDRDPGAKGLSS